MTNRILDIDVLTHRLDPTEAELWVIVTAEHVTATTELRGRFVGPKSAQSSTVEVAYALRPFPRKPDDLPPLAMRVVIPEPSPWTTQTPFVYDGVVELWQDGQRCDVRQMAGYKIMRSDQRDSKLL